MGKRNESAISIFRFRMALKNRFEFCFLFSPNFEKRFWTSYFVFRFRITLKNGYQFQFSFFVFASLWKTDMNFVFRFRITLKNGFEFRFSFSHHFEKQIWISFVILAWLEKRITAPVQSFEAPTTPWGLTGAFTFYVIAAKKHAAIVTLAYPRWRRKMTNIWTLYNLKSQNAR